MATSLPLFEPFDCTDSGNAGPRWNKWIKRLEILLRAMDITNSDEDRDQKKALLLHYMGAECYEIYETMEKSTDTFNDIKKSLTDYFVPKSNTEYEKYVFRNSKQQDGESLDQFCTRLKKLAVTCEFPVGTSDGEVKSQLIQGCKSSDLRRKALSESMTLSTLLEKGKSMELSSLHASAMETSPPAQLNKVSHTNQRKPYSKNRKSCYNCGGHFPHRGPCPAKDKICYNCRRYGHLSKFCRSPKRAEHDSRNAPSNQPSKQRRKIHNMDDDTVDQYGDENPSSVKIGKLGVNKLSSTKPIWVYPSINGRKVKFELDTGCALSIMPDRIYRETLNAKLQPCDTILTTYTGETVKPLGILNVTVQLNGQREKLELYVVQNGSNCLFGRDWLKRIQLNWSEIKELSTSNSTNTELQSLLDKHKPLFQDGIGELKNYTARLALKDNVTPVFRKYRNIPYALRDKVKEELDRLEAQGIIEPVTSSQWATPIVSVVKPNGNVRICGDFKVTVNPALKAEHCVLPKVDDIFASLAGGQKFSKIDLTQAFLSMKVDEKDTELLTINTPFGLYRYKRLCYGITDTPGKFQKAINEILKGIPFTKCIMDDIIVSGYNDSDHLKHIGTVFTRLQEHGLRVNKAKCAFMKEKITFCGHTITSEGLEKETSKVDAIRYAPTPTNVSEVRSFIGMVNYYHKFLPNIAEVLHPLYELTEKHKRFNWNQNCEKAFNTAKELIISDSVLVHYDPDLPIVLHTDASSYGLACVMSHKMPDGTEKPIMFLSRSLSKAEKNYAVIDKEATAIVWSIKKLYHYLYGKPFTLVTDHKPLIHIFSPTKTLPEMTSMRLQRYAIFLSGLRYNIQYRNTKYHANCDGLSRLPLPNTTQEEIDVAEVHHLGEVQKTPLNYKDVQRFTQKDVILSNVLYSVMSNRWSNIDGEYSKYFYKRIELSVHNGCILWGTRVVIPPRMRNYVLQTLHTSHPGIVKMKSLARSYVWWPGIDNDIHKLCKNCFDCSKRQSNPPKSELHSWKLPEGPWKRIHIDFAGPFMDHMFLLVVDAYSKWLEVRPMKTASTQTTIEALREMIARWGLPDQIHSDNATTFTSAAFKEFCQQNGIKQSFSPPYNPSSNGQVERYVQSLKNSLRCSKGNGKSLNHNLQEFLLFSRNTPHSTTGEKPSVLMINRSLKSSLDLLKPNIRDIVAENQSKSPQNFRKMRTFDEGEEVLVRDYRTGVPQNWQSATIHERLGPLQYKIITSDGNEWKRHADQILHSPAKDNQIQSPLLSEPEQQITSDPPVQNSKPSLVQDIQPPESEDIVTENNSDSSLRRSTRIRKPPDRYGFD